MIDLKQSKEKEWQKVYLRVQLCTNYSVYFRYFLPKLVCLILAAPLMVCCQFGSKSPDKVLTNGTV